MPRKLYDWKEVQRYYDAGNGFVECQRCFGFSHTAWIKALKRGELIIPGYGFEDRRRRYDWSAVQAFYDAGNSFRDCRAKYGFSNETWHKAVKRGEIKPRPQGMPIEQLLQGRRCRTHCKESANSRGLASERVLSLRIERLARLATDNALRSHKRREERQSLK